MNEFKSRLKKRVALSLCALDDDMIVRYMKESTELSCLIVPLLPVNVLSRLVFKLEPRFIEMLPIDSLSEIDSVRLSVYFLERINADCRASGAIPKCDVDVLSRKNPSISVKLLDMVANCIGRVSIKN